MQPIITAHHGSELFVTCNSSRLMANGLARGPHHPIHGPSAAAGAAAGLFPPSTSRGHHSTSSSASVAAAAAAAAAGLLNVGPDSSPRSPLYNSPPPGFAVKAATTSGGPIQRPSGFMVDMASAVAAPAPSTPVTSVGSGSPEMSVYYPQQLLANAIDPQSMVDPSAAASGCNAVTMATAVEAWRTLSAVHQSAAVAAALAGYGTPCHDSVPLPFGYHQYASNFGGIDVRRKNATRESTSTLKAWLYEHIKNPYPTKGEKIMLAIVTRMTLTQVSTWFANARRRLKKENKMQWSPRNRTGEDDDDDDDDDGLLTDDNCNNNTNAGDEYDLRSGSVDENSRDRVVNDDDDDDDVDVDVGREDTVGIEHPQQVSFSQSPHAVCGRPTVSTPLSKQEPAANLEHQQQQQRRVETKPRIWSLADVATSGITSSSTSSAPSSTSSFESINSCPRVPLGALWGAHTLPPLISNGLQPWNAATASSASPAAPPMTLFPNGLFPVAGFLKSSSSSSSSPDTNPYPARTGSATRVDAGSPPQMSPERRAAVNLSSAQLLPSINDDKGERR